MSSAVSASTQSQQDASRVHFPGVLSVRAQRKVLDAMDQCLKEVIDARKALSLREKQSAWPTLYPRSVALVESVSDLRRFIMRKGISVYGTTQGCDAIEGKKIRLWEIIGKIDKMQGRFDSRGNH